MKTRRTHKELDTMIVACPHCSEFDRFMFMGKKSLQLHCRELHNHNHNHNNNTEIEAEHDVMPGEGGLR